MGVDITAIKSFLAINGLTPQSPEGDIKNALAKANYSPEEIASALTMLAQPASPAPIDLVVPAERKTATFPGNGVEYTVQSGKKKPEKKGTGTKTFLILILLIALLVGAYYSGVMWHVASATEREEFCLAIADPAEQLSCKDSFKK
jgi:hypothetical protein